MVIRRGDIYFASLPEPRKSEPGYRRPVLVVQAEEFNRSRISTVIIVILTSNLLLREAPGNVFLSKEDTRLPKDTVANVSQIMTLDKSFLVEKICSISGPLLDDIAIGLRLVLSL